MKLQLTVYALLQQLHKVGAVLSWVLWDSLIGIKFSTTFCSPITIECVFGQCGHKLLEAKFSTTLLYR